MRRLRPSTYRKALCPYSIPVRTLPLFNRRRENLMLKNLSVRGFKTFRELDLELRPINILIGANGAGKSNLISLFKMLHEMMRGSFSIM